MTTLVWLQRELRLTHLPALQTALEEANNSGQKVILAYFHDPKQTVGDANTVWLAHSLKQLQQATAEQGGALWIIEGDFQVQLQNLITDYAIRSVYYSYQVGQPFQNMQTQALDVCQSNQVALQPFFSETLMPPGEINNQQGNPYVVFTPFYKTVLSREYLIELMDESVGDLNGLALKPAQANWLGLPSSLNQRLKSPWALKISAYCSVGEQAAWQRLDDFIESDMADYDEDRNFPALSATSGLSAALHFGEINPRAVYFYLQTKMMSGELTASVANPWLRQLVWAEFAKTLLWHFPETETEPFQSKFKGLRWQEDANLIELWQQGLTGFPIIDAGMRELWETGIMHNRVRMLVASFLTKNLNQHWLVGKRWFDNTLFDADPANNAMGWQWVAGCGVDAAPYYRLFNPITQSRKFDADGDYLRQWLPELKNLSSKAIHAPWEFPEECRLKGIALGETYPNPLVDLKVSRQYHLDRVSGMKAPL
jgi:deoxyribodipyrimidine photo-lyase